MVNRSTQNLAMFLAGALGLSYPLYRAGLLVPLSAALLVICAAGPLVTGAVQLSLGIRRGSDTLAMAVRLLPLWILLGTGM